MGDNISFLVGSLIGKYFEKKNRNILYMVGYDYMDFKFRETV